MELGDSDGYSDDFYSDEFEEEEHEKPEQQREEYEDREDDGFAFDATVQKQDGPLQEVVDYYQKYLIAPSQGESGSFNTYQFTESFMEG